MRYIYIATHPFTGQLVSYLIIDHSGTPLIRTPEMWPPLYSGHTPLITGPKGGWFRGLAIFVIFVDTIYSYHSIVEGPTVNYPALGLTCYMDSAHFAVLYVNY